MKKTIILFLYALVLIGMFFYSYVLIDPNITFFNSPVWSRFLETVLQIGYYQRSFSWQLYLVLVGCLTAFHFYFIKQYKTYNVIGLGIIIASILCLSYPLFSHDFIKYMFDAKILTQYHQNPYVMSPIRFSYDPWMRFLQWIEQPFRYGPVFLAIIAVPSFLAVGKFLINFILFKAIFMVFYLLAVYTLQKMNKKWAIIFATHPFLIIDGLINGHNDIIGVTFLIIGIFFLKKRKVLSRVFFLLSMGIKYLTLPVIFLIDRDRYRTNKLIFLFLLILPFLLLNSFIGNLFNAEIQTWYFIVLLGFIPLYEEIIKRLMPLFVGLLLCYYPFIYLGKWEQYNDVSIKHIIILVSLVINLCLFLIIPSWRKELNRFQHEV